MTREIIQAAVDQAIGDYPDGIDFVDLQRLLAERRPPIDLQASMPKGVFRGVSYKHDGFSWPGSKIGKEYSTGLVERGVRMPTAESNIAKQSPAEQTLLPASTYPAAPAQQQKALDRPPQQLQPIPQHMYSANQMQPQGSVVIRLGQVSETLDDMAPAMNTIFLQSAWALAKVAVFCATAAANIAAAAWRFVQKLLTLFGLKTNAPLQFSEQLIKPQLTYNPAHHDRVLDTDELAELDKSAASAIDHVLVCVKSGRPNDLPEDVDDKGRAELVSAMASSTKTGTPAAAEADSMDELFDSHVTAPAPKIELVPAQPDTFVLLNMAKEGFFTASIARTDARERETLQVLQARKDLAAAQRKLQAAKLNYLEEKNKKGIFKRFVPSEAVVIADDQITFDKAERSLADAITRHPPVIPLALIQMHVDALSKVKTAAIAHHAQMVASAECYSSLKIRKIALQQAQAFKANFEVFVHSPIADSLNRTVTVAESAPKVIALEVALAEKEIKIEALEKMEVPDDEKEEERQGQVQK